MSTTDSRSVDRLRGRAVLASASVIVGLLGPVAIAASSLTFGSSQDTDEAKVGAGLLIAGLFFVVLVWPFVGVLVIRWLVRARANAELLDPTAHRLSAGWVIAGWLVPLANIVIPVLVVNDVVRASNPDGGGLRAVGVWWSTWLGAWMLTLAGFVMAGRLDYPDGPRVLAQCLLSAMTLFIISAYSFRSLALTVAGWQDDHVGRPPRGSDVDASS